MQTQTKPHILSAESVKSAESAFPFAEGVSPPDTFYVNHGKRLLDLAILISSHILLFPIFLALWTLIPLAIWLQDRGPVFYKQTRAGKNGVPFTVYKFRTMVRNADKIGGPRTGQNDRRITPFGRLLRRTALDELPQTLAIWSAKMTFVGPRALAWKEQGELEAADPLFRARLIVKPGLTGLAQVEDPSDDLSVKLRYDIAYVSAVSPPRDLAIVLRSVRNTLLGRWDARARGVARRA